MDDDTTGRLPDETSPQPPESGETAAGAADAAETAVTSPGAGETFVAPPSDDAATRIMSGEAVAATQVMPAGDAGPPPPPPLRPQPTLMMSRPPNQSSSTWWIVLVVVLLALVAAAAAWYFLIRDKGEKPAPQPSPAFDWEGAWGRTDGTGGGVVVEPSGKDYKVTVYGSTLQVLGTATATTEGQGPRLFARERRERRRPPGAVPDRPRGRARRGPRRHEGHGGQPDHRHRAAQARGGAGARRALCVAERHADSRRRRARRRRARAHRHRRAPTSRSSTPSSSCRSA